MKLELILKKDSANQIVRNHSPWIYKGMVSINSALETAKPGSLVQILDNKAKPIAIGYFNPNNILACRVLSWNPKEQINQNFFYNLLKKSLDKRSKFFNKSYYRLVHSEGDFLPGLVIDRFGDVLVCQTSTAGMEELKPLWLPALEELLKPSTILLRDDIPIRKKEGLQLTKTIYRGQLEEITKVYENDFIYCANLLTGQKTGWFYDQRANRQYFSTLVKNKQVLDIYSHSGGFGIAAAKSGADYVTMLDSSAFALNLAKQAAELNNIQNKCNFIEQDAYKHLEECIEKGIKYNAIMADPPAFIKEKKYIESGLKGYQKLAYLCAQILEDNGIFAIASCSHHAQMKDFRRAVEAGIKKAGKELSLSHQSGADKDHPQHPALPEGGYLKFLVYSSS